MLWFVQKVSLGNKLTKFEKMYNFLESKRIIDFSANSVNFYLSMSDFREIFSNFQNSETSLTPGKFSRKTVFV